LEPLSQPASATAASVATSAAPNGFMSFFDGR
jgi:hypothetical protein